MHCRRGQCQKHRKFKVQHTGAWELFTKSRQQLSIPNTEIIAAAIVAIFRIILIAVATTHRHRNSDRATCLSVGTYLAIRKSCASVLKSRLMALPDTCVGDKLSRISNF